MVRKAAMVVICRGIDGVARYREEDMYFLRTGVADMRQTFRFCCAVD